MPEPGPNGKRLRQQPANRALDRALERAVDRALDKALDRALDKALDRALDRSLACVSSHSFSLRSSSFAMSFTPSGNRGCFNCDRYARTTSA